MATITGTVVLDGTNATPVAGVSRIGTNTRVFQDADYTFVDDNGNVSGQSVTLITRGFGSADSSQWSTGTINFNDSVMWLDGTTGNAQDFSRDTANPVTFTWTNGEINYRGGITHAEGGPFLRFRSTTTGQFVANIVNVAGTTFNNYNYNRADPTTAAQPGFNLATINVAQSSIAGASFNGWWANYVADLAAIGVDFSNSTYRPIANANNRYHVRLNAASDTASRSGIFAGCNFSNFGTLTDGASAGLQMFGDLAATVTNFTRDVFIIDCIFPDVSGTRQLTVNTTTNATRANARACRSWMPQVRRPNLDLVADARIKFNPSNSTLYPAPPTQLGRTFAPNTAPNNTAVHDTGYYRQTGEVIFSATTTSGIVNYNDFTGTPFTFSSLTDRPGNNVWAFNSTHQPNTGNTGVDLTTGLPSTETTIGYDVDEYMQAPAPVDALTVDATDFNQSYRTIKNAWYIGLSQYPFSDIISDYNVNGTLTTPLALTISNSSNTALAETVASPTSLTFRTAAVVSRSTGTGAITGLVSDTSISFGGLDSTLAGVAIDDVNISAPSLTNVRLFATQPTDTSTNFSFKDCAVGGTITADTDGNNDVYLVFENCTEDPDRPLVIQRGTGNGDVIVVSPPVGADLTDANVSEAPFTVAVDINLVLPTGFTLGGNTRMDVFNITGGSLVSATPLASDFTGSSITSGLTGLSTLGRSGGITDIRVVISAPGLNDSITDINVGTHTNAATITQAITATADVAFASGASYNGTVGNNTQDDADRFANSISTTWDAANTRVLYDISGYTTGQAGNVETNRLMNNAKGQAAYNVGVANHNISILFSPGQNEVVIREGTYQLRNGETTGQQQLQSIRQRNNSDGTLVRVVEVRVRSGFRDVLVQDNPTGATDAQIEAAVNASNAAQTTALQTSITNDGASTRSTVWASKFS